MAGRLLAPLLFVVALAASLPTLGDTASAHIHTHQQNKADNNERTEDGAFSPRDADHYAEGEHHEEFDHEAILGANEMIGFIRFLRLTFRAPLTSL